MDGTTKIIPIILSGGVGTRLWPLSLASKPKQFQRFGGETTLLMQTLTRCRSDVFDSRPILVGSPEHRGLMLNTLQSTQINADIILEPHRRNSCAAVFVGALRAMERDANAIVLVLAADHHIPDHSAFETCAVLAVGAAMRGDIVTFGVVPKFASTGYGYILPDASTTDQNAMQEVVRVHRFVEKPDAETAERCVAQGYLWNSGNFLFRAASFVDEVRSLAPDLYEAVTQSLAEALRDPDFIRLEGASFARTPSVSVDVAIMEKTTRAVVLPVSYEWSDMGTWDSVAATLHRDENGNSIVGRGMIVGGRNVVILSEGVMVTVVECDDVIIVATAKSVLAVKKGASERVKILTEQLKSAGLEELL